MNGFARILPYLWPYRRKLFLSIVFGILVALFWGLNLSAAFPVVQVLFKGQNLGQYVDQEIRVMEGDITHRQGKLENYDRELAGLEAKGRADDGTQVRITRQRTKEMSKISTSSRKLLVLRWSKSYVIPLLPSDQFDTFAVILVLLLAATLLKGLCIFVQEVLIGSVVELTIMAVRKECFRRTLALDYQTLSINGTSELMSRFTFDMTLLANGLALLGGKVVREPLKAAVCLMAAWFLVSWQLTLLSLLFAPLAGLFLFRIGRTLKQASHRLMEQMSRIYKTLEETFDSLKIVIAFNGGLKHRQRFHRENKEYFANALKIVRIDALTSPTTEVMGLFMAFIGVLPGAYLVLRDTTSIWGIRLVSQPMGIGELSLMYAFLAGMIDPARKLSSVYAKLKRSSAAADRIAAMLDAQPLVKEPSIPKPLPRHARAIEFRKVGFAYAAAEPGATIRPQVLEDVSFKAQAGEVVVVVGENGSGKSTLVNLLPRFFDPDRGAVLIDDVDIREVRLRDLRSQLGIVTQETLLFDETIYENIRYGKPDATPAEIEEAARQAHVTPFVNQLPDGFETRVGEKGQRLSGGQRQRIALARAILRDPAVLILDEATSAIDAQSEVLIHETLRQFVKGRTTFIITHSIRQSCLDFVSRIVVMDQGRLIATGNHEQLLETCPVYHGLFKADGHRSAA